MNTEDLETIDAAIGVILAHMNDPHARVTAILTAKQHRAMKRQFASVRDHHEDSHRMTPRVP